VNRVQLSNAAANDIREIEAHTVTRFGMNQALAFLEKLQASLGVIASMPEIGNLRPELDPPGYSFRYHAILKNFIVVYDESSGNIRVARILHGARNLLNELLRDAGAAEE